MVAIAEQTVPSGLAALLIAATPLWLMVLRVTAGDRPRALSLAGTAIGFAGIAVLARPGGHDGDIETWGLLLLVGASACWAIGSFFSSRLPMPRQRFRGHHVGDDRRRRPDAARGRSAPGSWTGFSVSEVDGAAWAWLAYLVVFGSLAAFSAYVWLLQNAPISLTATYAYVNPVVAVLLGALVLAEPITTPIVIGGAVVVIGVGMVVSTERPAGQRTDPAPGPGPGPSDRACRDGRTVAGAKG